MTEKIARRGVFTPDSFEPDLLQKLTVAQLMSENDVVLNSQNTAKEVRQWLEETHNQDHYFMTVDNDGSYAGVLKLTDLFVPKTNTDQPIKAIVNPVDTFLKNNDTLRTAVEAMAKYNTEALPVVAAKGGKIIGLLTYPDVLLAYKHHIEENETANTQISLKRRRIKMLIKGKKMIRINDVSKS
jgi:Mg/Co/Ni transporter MgtE